MTAERKLLILGLLRLSDMHGYVLNAHLDTMSPITLKKPAAYNLLDRMEGDGWIEHHEESTGERQRKVFSVTAAGEARFFTLLREQLETYAPNDSPSMVSLSFLDELPSSEALALLQRRCTAILAYRSSLQPAPDTDGTDPHGGSMALPLEYARRLADLDLSFIDDVIKRMQA